MKINGRFKKAAAAAMAVIFIWAEALPASAAGIYCDAQVNTRYETASPSSPRLSRSSVTITVGSCVSLKVNGTKNTVKWSSSDRSVCTVSKNGKVTAKGAGTAKIYAKAGNKILFCKVSVIQSSISPIADKTLDKGEKMTLSMNSRNVRYVKADSTDSSIVRITDSYVSGDTVKVSIEAVSGGTAYINVTDADNKNTSEKVKVKVNSSYGSFDIKKEPTYGIQIQLVDNGDNTASFVVIPTQSSEPDHSAEPDSAAKPDTEIGYAEKMLMLVNEERSKQGAPALVLDPDLCKAAQVRAAELGESFSHTRPNGKDCFSILGSYNIHCVYAGENIASGPSTCEGAMKLWMNSSGHRSNILRSGWSRMGVGYDSAAGGWVQIFTD